MHSGHLGVLLSFASYCLIKRVDETFTCALDNIVSRSRQDQDFINQRRKKTNKIGKKLAATSFQSETETGPSKNASEPETRP